MNLKLTHLTHCNAFAIFVSCYRILLLHYHYFFQCPRREGPLSELLERPAPATGPPPAAPPPSLERQGASHAGTLCQPASALVAAPHPARRRRQGQVQVSLPAGGDGGRGQATGERAGGRPGIAAAPSAM